MSNLEITGFKKFLGLLNSTRPTASSNLAVPGIFLIQLFPNWTASSPITYTNFSIQVFIIQKWIQLINVVIVIAFPFGPRLQSKRVTSKNYTLLVSVARISYVKNAKSKRKTYESYPSALIFTDV